MPATATTEARIQEDRDATMHVDNSFCPEGAFAFPAAHKKLVPSTSARRLSVYDGIAFLLD